MKIKVVKILQELAESELKPIPNIKGKGKVTSMFLAYMHSLIFKGIFFWAYRVCYLHTVELQWLDENLFESGVVRAIEGLL